MIWIIGRAGLLGAEVSLALEKLGLSFAATGRELDILAPHALRDFARGKDIHAIVNCAGYTAVDRAEAEEDLAVRVNAEGPENLARLSLRLGARLIHLSTDYVFSGTKREPYLESDAPDPVNAYGRSKAEGEARVLAAAPDSVIVRSAWLYGRHGGNFVSTMLKLMRERDSVDVVDDQHGSPTWAADLAGVLAGLATRTDLPAGIYHYSGEGQASWYGFAVEIQNLALKHGLLDRACALRPVATSLYPRAAHRPLYSVLSQEKIKVLGFRAPPWRESLERFILSLRGVQS